MFAVTKSRSTMNQLLNLLTSVVEFWLRHTAQCNNVCSTWVLHEEKGWDRERAGRGMTQTAICTWLLLSLAIKNLGWHWISLFPGSLLKMG